MFLDKFNYDVGSTLDQSGKWGAGADRYRGYLRWGNTVFYAFVPVGGPPEELRCLSTRNTGHSNHTVLAHVDREILWGPSWCPAMLGVIARCDSCVNPANYYLGKTHIPVPADGTTFLTISRVINGIETELQSWEVSVGETYYQLELSVCGSSICARLGGSTECHIVEDSTITEGCYTGFTGIAISGAPVYVRYWRTMYPNDRVFLVVEESSGLVYPCTELNAGAGEEFNIIGGNHDFSRYEATPLGDGILRVGALT